MQLKGHIRLAAITATVAFVSSLTGYILGVRANNGKSDNAVPTETVIREEKAVEEPEIVEKAEENAEKSIVKKYVLKETDGKVALIILNPDGKNTVYKTYDISVGTLPEADRMKLKEGIEAESLSEALLMVEDYL